MGENTCDVCTYSWDKCDCQPASWLLHVHYEQDAVSYAFGMPSMVALPGTMTGAEVHSKVNELKSDSVVSDVKVSQPLSYDEWMELFGPGDGKLTAALKSIGEAYRNGDYPYVDMGKGGRDIMSPEYEEHKEEDDNE